MRYASEKAHSDGRCEPNTVSQSASGRKRVVRGWIAMTIGCGALAVPLLIGDWGSLFLLACAPIGMFILVVGMVEVVRGAREADREGR